MIRTFSSGALDRVKGKDPDAVLTFGATLVYVASPMVAPLRSL